ncbi:hypothetical protein IV203_002163 [Nitzschia inconspicua]|uniref:Uncharacterized protein n=1 Tax=Nitzschia inconspicua TaxID=303405 RepID=A0A9K3PRQ4_9STRA|nr:hypothetical protein IV203_002163 [Nitzschia inconspicua]
MVTTRRSSGGKVAASVDPFRDRKHQRRLAVHAAGIHRIGQDTNECFDLVQQILAQAAQGTNAENIQVHNRKQANERTTGRNVVLHTAITWGWRDPSLTSARREYIAKAACRQVAYDMGYPAPLAHTRLPHWYGLVHAAITTGENADPCSPSNSGRATNVDIDEGHPGYLREMYRYAERVCARASRNTRYSVDVDILQAINSGEWIQLLVTEGMTAEALLEEIKTHYDLDEYVSDSIVIGSPETNMLHLGIWMSIQAVVTRVHRRRGSHPDALARSVEDAWNNYLSPSAFQNVHERLKIVLHCIVDDNGGNSLVERKRGKFFRDCMILEIDDDDDNDDLEPPNDDDLDDNDNRSTS